MIALLIILIAFITGVVIGADYKEQEYRLEESTRQLDEKLKKLSDSIDKLKEI